MRQITLRPPEIILLRRALRIYVSTYQKLAQKNGPQWEKEELAKMAAAADVLSERLLHETVPEGTFSKEQLQRVAKTIKQYGDGHFAEDEETWAVAAKAITHRLRPGASEELQLEQPQEQAQHES